MSGSREPELYRQVDDAEASFSELSQKTKIVHPLEKRPFGKVFAIQDPAGQPIYLIELAKVRPNIPAMMKAVRLYGFGGPADLVYESIPTPELKADEALVRVAAAAITRDELGWPTNRLPAVPSFEFSGVVAAVGSGISDLVVGEAVYALSPFDRDGAAAEYIAVPRACLAPQPKTIGSIESAAIPLAALSAWQGLFTHGHLEKGQRVLICGAAGGVGNYTVQLARYVGAHVIEAVSSANLEKVHGLGADEAFDPAIEPIEEAVQPVDLVLDTVGGGILEKSMSSLRPGGRLVSIASEPSQDLAAARGITALYFVVESDSKQLLQITHLVESGRLCPTIDAVFPLSEARQAFEHGQSRHPAGKIVLQVAEI